MLPIIDRLLLAVWFALPFAGILLHLAGVQVHLSLAISSVLAVGVLAVMLERGRSDENSQRRKLN